ncbi:hypothetical protein AOLI_G00161000 [Acnodon oligacanthus]
MEVSSSHVQSNSVAIVDKMVTLQEKEKTYFTFNVLSRPFQVRLLRPWPLRCALLRGMWQNTDDGPHKDDPPLTTVYTKGTQ